MGQIRCFGLPCAVLVVVVVVVVMVMVVVVVVVVVSAGEGLFAYCCCITIAGSVPTHRTPTCLLSSTRKVPVGFLATDELCFLYVLTRASALQFSRRSPTHTSTQMVTPTNAPTSTATRIPTRNPSTTPFGTPVYTLMHTHTILHSFKPTLTKQHYVVPVASFCPPPPPAKVQTLLTRKQGS